MANKVFLIGIDKYLHHKNLKSSVKGITDFKNILLEKFDFNENDFYELVNENATNIKIQDAFRGYIKELKEEDNLLIVFSGHGDFDNKSDIGYWVPYDARDYTNNIANNIITRYIEKIKAKHIFIISDSCFSNSIFIINGTKDISEYFSKRSRWALTSAFQTSIDSDEYSNTLFMEYIVKFLESTDYDFRVSELIEYVKKEFEINRFQKPQGAPLLINGHEGGEFVFKIRQQIDTRKFKGYSNFGKILKIYKKHSHFKEIETFEDRTRKIGFQLFQEIDSVLKTSIYYLYLYEGINQTQTLKLLREKHPILFTNKKLIIFISTEKGQKVKNIRKNNIKEKFKPLNIFYIEEFIKNHCTPNINQIDKSKYLNITNFIIPTINITNNLSQENESLQEFFKTWYEKPEEPILIIKGSGGIGKTTLAKYLADNVINEYENATVLFIDSIQVKNSLLKNKNRAKLSLYNFYEALYDITDNLPEKLSEELFNITVDAGNLLIIIDGLDEVISKIPNFNVSDFIHSIEQLSNVLGKGKVIITSRTYFWDITNFKENTFKIVEIEPFNEKQARNFFEKSFNNNTKKIKKGLKLANDFKYPGNSDDNNIFHPYVLDIIRSILEIEAEDTNLVLTDFNSDYLNSTNKNDYIIYRVCEREKIRIGQIDTDEQIKFFLYFSVEKRGIIRVTDLKNEMEQSLQKRLDKTTIEAFKSHPFLKIADKSIVFRYDFLADIFKSIFMSSYFDYKKENFQINDSFTDILIESCWYGSALNIEIVNRLTHWNTDDILLISDIFSQIIDRKTLNENRKNKALANLFNLCLNINHNFKSNNINENTILLRDLFEEKNKKIKNVHIIDIVSDDNIKFDFSSLEIHDSIFENYNNFWRCKFNNETKFIKSIFLNLKSNYAKSGLTKDNFIDCTFDSTMEKSLQSIDKKIKKETNNVVNFLRSFFHLFMSNGRLGRQWEDKIIMPRYSGINKVNIDYKYLIRILKKYQIINITIELGRNKISISNDKKELIIKFINDGTLSIELLKLIEELKK